MGLTCKSLSNHGNTWNIVFLWTLGSIEAISATSGLQNSN